MPATDLEQRLPRSSWGCLLLLVPILAILGTFIAYGSLFWSGIQGRQASGDRVAIYFQTCPSAQEIVRDRVAHMGLIDAVFETTSAGFVLTVTLPDDSKTLFTIPATLAQQGVLEIRDSTQEDTLFHNDALSSASVRLDMKMEPWILLKMEPHAVKVFNKRKKATPNGTLDFYVDGTLLGSQSNHILLKIPEVELTPKGNTHQDIIEHAASMAIILNNGPILCDTTVLEVKQLEA